MIQIKGDIWQVAQNFPLCITTNGTIKSNGQAVMGRGVALQAKQRWSKIQDDLAKSLQIHGNHTVSLGEYEVKPDRIKYPHIISLPVKHQWFQGADLNLIERSLRELILVCNKHSLYTVFLPRPGCGNGGLKWKNEVEPLVGRILNDNRFIVMEYEQ